MHYSYRISQYTTGVILLERKINVKHGRETVTTAKITINKGKFSYGKNYDLEWFVNDTQNHAIRVMRDLVSMRMASRASVFPSC